MYTVKEISELSGVTVKALHHYHRIGLLAPGRISEAGYRLYGTQELERLQHIMFYKELDFGLAQIKAMLDGTADRPTLLAKQEALLLARRQRLDAVLHTLQTSIGSLKEGRNMTEEDLFKGFKTEMAWNAALEGQNRYLKDAYGLEPLAVEASEVTEMNEKAEEAATFMSEMARALREGAKHSDERVRGCIRSHLAFLDAHGHPTSPDEFAARNRFFLQDDFHRGMLEGQQTGLAYYLAAAADSFAAAERPE